MTTKQLEKMIMDLERTKEETRKALEGGSSQSKRKRAGKMDNMAGLQGGKMDNMMGLQGGKIDNMMGIQGGKIDNMMGIQGGSKKEVKQCINAGFIGPLLMAASVGLPALMKLISGKGGPRMTAGVVMPNTAAGGVVMPNTAAGGVIMPNVGGVIVPNTKAGAKTKKVTAVTGAAPVVAGYYNTKNPEIMIPIADVKAGSNKGGKNPWLKHLAKFAKDNKHLTYRECMKEAKKTY